MSISKNKIELSESTNIDDLLHKISQKYLDTPQNKIDGLKIDFKTNGYTLENQTRNQLLEFTLKVQIVNACFRRTIYLRTSTSCK